MNKIFDIKRFGRYLLYDLDVLKSRYGVSLLLMGLAPVIVYCVVNILAIIFARNTVDTVSLLTVTVFVSAAVLGLTAPAKIYGAYTEKQAGSSWILLPASTVEKVLSLMIILMLVVPVIFLALQSISILLLSFAVPDGFDAVSSILTNIKEEISLPFASFFGIIFWGNAVSMLFFALGALFFKKHKVGKTILCDFLINMLFLIIAARIFFRNWSFSPEDIEMLLDTVDPVRFISVFTLIFVAVNMVLLVCGLYFRTKKMQF